MNFVLKTIFGLTTLLSLHLHSSIFDHLKKASNKSDDHSMSNIDFIYIINLDKRPEKFKSCLDQLLPYGINPYRFSAVNGWELTLEQINDIGVKFSPGMDGGFEATTYPMDGNLEPRHHEIMDTYGQTYFCLFTARGTIGIVLSHLSILKDAYDSGYDTIWVMEDDIRVDQDPRILSTLIDKLDGLVGKGDWDILFTDMDIRDKENNYVPAFGSGKRPDCVFTNDGYARDPISADFRVIGARFGAHSMIIRRSGIEKLLNFYKEHQMFLPYDMDYYYPPGIKMFTVLSDVVTNMPNAPTDNGVPNYLKNQVSQGR